MRYSSTQVRGLGSQPFVGAAEHEAQFVEVVCKLVERGKQVILLSHNKRWVDAVRKACRSINGWMYEITGYFL